MTEREQTPYVTPDITLVGDEHVRRYQDTNGEVGYLWNKATCCVLTTKGRKTGEARHSALICGFDGDDVIVVASKGGAPSHPAWYLNLNADPNVGVQVKADRFPATAQVAEGPERDRLWKVMTAVWPNYDEYTRRTTRVIPVVVLKRTA